MLYKPLRGHQLVTFILLNDFEAVIQTVRHTIPCLHWEKLRVWKHNDHYWLQLHPAIRLDCQSLKGQAFIAQGRHHQAAERIETDRLATVTPLLLWLEFGQLQSLELQALVPISCDTLLQIPNPNPLRLFELPPVEETASVHYEKIQTTRDTHRTLAIESFKPSIEPQAFLASIQANQPMPQTHPSFWQGLSNRIVSLVHPITSLWRRRSSAPSPGMQPTLGSKAPSLQLAKSPRYLWQGISDYVRERLMRSRLSTLIGRRQAEYFHRMMKQFDQGNLSEALRMAVPLSDYRTVLESKSSPMIGLPGQRQTFRISRQNSASHHSFHFAEDSYKQMRAAYEAAYQHLKQSGQSKEAAFVLAELLNRIAEAVDYLVQEGFLEEAAEIAEGRLDKPEKAIALWIQAGQLDHAMNLAIRTNRFKAALLLLQQDTEHYCQLESLWLERLLRNGDFETVFHHYLKNAAPIARLRNFLTVILPQSYLDNPIWLARYSCLCPWSEVDSLLGELFQDPLSSDFAAFLDIFSSLLEQQPSWKEDLIVNCSQSLLKELYRQILMYRKRPVQLTNHKLNLLRSLITDRLFVDCKPQNFTNPFIPSPNEGPTQRMIRFHPGEPLLQDIGLTPEGRWCVALGSLGVRVYNTRGRVLHHAPIPAHGLVSPTTGGVVLAVEHREKLYRIHRIQLHTIQSRFLGQQPITAYGRCHNGCTWPLTFIPNRVSLIDVDAAEWSSVWSIGSLDATIHTFVSDESQLSFLLSKEQKTEIWQYRLPQLRLASRSGIDNLTTDQPMDTLILGHDGQICGLKTVHDANRQPFETQVYRSVNLLKYECIGRFECKSDQGRILYSDAKTIIVSLPLDSQQRIQVFGDTGRHLSLLFEIECPLGDVCVQAIYPWIALGQSDQIFLYHRSTKQGNLFHIN